MYGPLRPLPYSVLRDQLEKFSVVECGESDDLDGGCCRVLRLMRMGLSTSTYYNFPFDGPNTVIPEPEIDGILQYFGIEREEFMTVCDGACGGA